MEFLMELELRNVGIIKSASLEFKQGLNLIVGASSSGKSTLLRAIRSMMDNSFTDSNISYGERKMAIKMVFDGHTATYIRDLDNPQRKSAYQIDGKVYTKVGRSSLGDLSDLFKLCPVEIDGEKINFNFSAQFSGPFLLLGSPSLLYSILTYRSSFDITKINDLYNTDLKKVKQDISVLLKTKEGIEKEKESKESQLACFEGFPDTYINVQSLKQRYSEFSKLKNIYSLYKEATRQKLSILGRIGKLSFILKAYSGYNESLTVLSLMDNYVTIKKQTDVLSNKISLCKETEGAILDIIPKYDNAFILSKYISVNKLRTETGKRVSLLREIDHSIDKATPVYTSVLLLKKKISIECSLKNLYKRSRLCSDLLGYMDSITPGYRTVELLRSYIMLDSKIKSSRDILSQANIGDTGIIVLLGKYVELSKSISLVKEGMLDISNSLEKISTSLGSVEVCPLCKQPIDTCRH